MNSQDIRNLQEAYLDVYYELDEAEGSYGQTPKATAAYIALATRRGGKKSTKSKALQHAIRSSARQSINTPSHRSNMTPSDRTYYRGQDENRGGDREGIDFDEFDNFDEFDTGPSGPGGMPKGKKLKRQRIRGISASYEPDLFDVILEYLITEGYADTEDSALVIMANMSEEWRQSIMLEQSLPSNYTDYKAPSVQAAHVRAMRDASILRQIGMNATAVDPEDDAKSNLDAVKSDSGVPKPLAGTTIRYGAGKGRKAGDPGINIGPNN